jgi:hypothetical protein
MAGMTSVRAHHPQLPSHDLEALLRVSPERSRFGDVVLVVFLVAQMLDGVFTYLGVKTFGPSAEGNPLLSWLMLSVGEGPALAGAKVMAGSFGIALHLTAVHKTIAVLTLIYLFAAVLPWAAILLGA